MNQSSTHKSKKPIILVAVAAGVLALVAIGIFLPGILKAEKAKREAAAITALAAIRNAQAAFRPKTEGVRYGTLSELGSSGLIDPTLAGGAKDGYRFDVRVNDSSYRVLATPLEGSGCRGCRSFYMDETGEFRGGDKNGAEATAAEPILF